MSEAVPCPQCRWGRLIYPLEIAEQRCIGCRGKRNRVNTGLPVTWPCRTVYRSEDNCYGQRGVIDDD